MLNRKNTALSFTVVYKPSL